MTGKGESIIKLALAKHILMDMKQGTVHIWQHEKPCANSFNGFKAKRAPWSLLRMDDSQFSIPLGG